MNTYIDWVGRLSRFQGLLAAHDIDALIATRLKTITHVSGAFVPWRSVAVIPRDGDVVLFTVGMDANRIAEESWLNKVIGYSRQSAIEMAAKAVHDLGFSSGKIGVEDGYSWYLPEGMITHHEYELLTSLCPDAVILNATSLVDQHMLIKEPAQIELMRQATAICDAAQEQIRQKAAIGMTEVEIAGIAEGLMRSLGSEFAWTFTGGQEIASGHRTWTGACTPSTRKVVQRGDFVLLDLHAMYGLMLGDVSHNGVMGKPTPAQQELIDAYTDTAYFLIDALRPGRTMGEVSTEVRSHVVKNGWGDYIRGFGHGIGHFGNEWFPSFTNVAIPYSSDPGIVLEPGFMEIIAVTCNQPGVGGLRLERPAVITETGVEVLSKTPIEPWVLDD